MSATYLPKADGRLTGLFPNVLPSGDTSGATDTAAIQANEDAGRTTVLVPGATYYVAGLVKKSSCSIYFNDATMKLPNGANTDVIVGDQFASLTRTNSTSGIHDFRIAGPGFIDGNKANQGATTTVTSAPFNLAASFTVTLANSSRLPATGTASINTQSGPQYFSWTANNTTTNTLTASSTSGGRVATGAQVIQAGYGIRVYGYNFDIDGNLLVHNCVGDGIWTEWAATVNVGTGTPELEARIGPIKSYENGRNGFSFLGPHDSIFTRSVFIRNPSAGWKSGNSSIAYLNQCHGWGSPQAVSFDDHTGSTFVNCVGEMTGGTGSRAWRLYNGATHIVGSTVLWAGSGGQVGIELNAVAGAYIDAKFSGGFSSGALLITSSAGGNVIRGVMDNLTNRPMVSGTPDPTDIIDLIPGTNTTTPRYTQNVVTPDTINKPADSGGFAGWAYDPATTSTQTALTSGTPIFVRVKATASQNVTRLWSIVGVAGSGLTAGQCLIGLYDAAGTQLAVSADQSTVWNTTGAKFATISSTPVVAGSYYYVGILAVGTTPPSFARGFGTASGSNAGIGSAPFRFNQGAAGQTSLPAPVTPSGFTSTIGYWAAMA